jgi:hypothetical protein
MYHNIDWQDCDDCTKRVRYVTLYYCPQTFLAKFLCLKCKRKDINQGLLAWIVMLNPLFPIPVSLN